jgi:hypothetical protein
MTDEQILEEMGKMGGIFEVNEQNPLKPTKHMLKLGESLRSYGILKVRIIPKVKRYFTHSFLNKKNGRLTQGMGETDFIEDTWIVS